MTFDSDSLLARLQLLTAGELPDRWLVAFSGGVDSTVLLHALAMSAQPGNIQAIHINHGLHADSDRWERHCSKVADSLGIAFESCKVTVAGKSENGPEAAARRARYDAFLSLVRFGDCLLSAHHENDQAETLLLNLMRGSGPAGLAGIGLQQSFGRGQLLRPMLGVPGDEIEAYAKRHSLEWIDDPSNADTRFDRNFLRSEILPRLAARWPAVSNRLRRSAELVGESSELLNDLADIDLRHLGTPGKLGIDGLQALPAPRQRNVLRRAVRLRGLPPPPATRLYQVINELIPARIDAQPLVEWRGACIRRYRDHLFVLPDPSGSHQVLPGTLQADGSLLPLGKAYGSLRLALHHGEGIDPDLVEEGVEVRYRTGGESIRIDRGGRTRKLKKLLQEEGIVPWMRPRVPLLYSGDRLLAVGDLWLASDCIASPGLKVDWIDRPPLR